MPAPTVAIVIPVFNEEAVLPELFGRLAALFEAQRDLTWRAVLVDDGSRDGSAALVRAQTQRDPRFELVELSRNFGFQAALAAGLAHARSSASGGPVDAVVTMDADLQDPPELIPALIAAWRNGAEVVRATRRSRAETGLRRVGFDAFHAVFGRLSDVTVDTNAGTFGLLGRDAIEAFHRLPERNRFFPGLRAWIGFPTADVPYDRQERAAGKPQQTFRRLVRYALDGLFSFSYLPLRVLTYTGIFVGSVGFCLGLYYVVKRLIDIETAPTGFTTLAALVLFLGGVQLIAIGVLGEYLGRIYDEVKQRPIYLVKPPRGRA
ncbi:MAG: glycosyltransferase family 2 protein [Verrucomicrobia bacterium]|nr:glycosyltransferase family 2 protein [Verrucomicrobiota bacterium]